MVGRPRNQGDFCLDSCISEIYPSWDGNLNREWMIDIWLSTENFYESVDFLPISPNYNFTKAETVASTY